MTLRVWVVGALAGLPLIVSGALGQTPATPPACNIFSARGPFTAGASPESPPAQIPASPPAPTAASTPSISPASPPASSGGLVSPFMPEPAAPTAGAEPTPNTPSTSNAPPAAAAPIPSTQAAAPLKPKKVVAASAAARDRAQRRSSPDASARHLLRDRQGVRALFGDRGRRRLANRHRCDRPRNEGSGSRETAQAPGHRRRPRRGRVGRPRMGQRAHSGGEAISGAHGTAPDRNRLRRDAESDQYSGEGALQAARFQRQSPGGTQFFLR